MTKYRIPVRVVRPPAASRAGSSEGASRAVASERPEDRLLDMEAPLTLARTEPSRAEEEEAVLEAVSSADVPSQAAESAESGEVQAQQTAVTEERARAYRLSEENRGWRERALRLQAEMAAYRRRQRRVAREDAQAEHTALLKDVLAIADNLDRALAVALGDGTGPGTPDSLAEGVELTRSALQRTLNKHGLERIPVEGKPFDPAWHEAIYVVPAATLGVEPGTVVEVLEAGYRRQGALFRPAKVVVAQ